MEITAEEAPRPAGLDEAIRVATGMYSMLGRREALLGGRLCSDPAWNMLLDLLIAEVLPRPLSVSDVCLGSRAPPATAHRYLALLVEAGLVRRGADASDRRRHQVRLTPCGRKRMLDLLLERRRDVSL